MKRWSGKAVAVILVAIMSLSPVAVPRAEAAYGRTEGAYAGGMLGAVGGASLGSAIVAGAGIANPLLGGAIMATSAVGAGLAGVRVGSWAGDKVDKRFTPKQIWTVVGALTGGMLGVVLGPAGSIVGKVIGGALGAALGGFIANKMAAKADRDFNPRTVGALMGAINGAVMGGPVGAAAGIAAGYVGGHLLDKYIMVDASDRDGTWGSGRKDSDGVATDEDGDGIPDWYPEGYGDDYVGGYDREGYDRMGFDRDGYDREGFDRFGYDEDGIDRKGYDKRGYKVGEEYVSEKPEQGDSECYDPDVYNQYWKSYSQLGGDYPDFDQSHWKYFPKKQRDDLEQRYQAGQHRRMGLVMRSDIRKDSTLGDLRDEYQEAVRQFREACKRKDATAEERRILMRRVTDLEKQLQEVIKSKCN